MALIAAAAASLALLPPAAPPPTPPVPVPAPIPAPAPPAVERPSRALGSPVAGRLVRGVQLAAEGEAFFTWDPVRKVSPNPGWRRWATDRTVERVVQVLTAFRAANPGAPRIGVGDLSRPRGGAFGARIAGGLGHASHQNGLDVDVYYPRLDGLEHQANRARQVDFALSQDLVNRFVAAGAVYVFVGPRVRLRGPKRIVQPLAHHDDHLHVRFRP